MLIRTPDERFENLPGYDFAPHYVQVLDDVRMHYVDEGAGGNLILCLHGEPTWAYLYRKMIPLLSASNRVIAPDMIGFGRSDKFTETQDYSLQLQIDALRDLIHTLDLNNITLVCQDWGGIIGLPLAVELPERFSRLVIMNAALPTGDIDVGPAFEAWRSWVKQVGRQLPIDMVIKRASTNGEAIPPDVLTAYLAPFPDETYKAAPAIYPLLVPVGFDDPGAALMRDVRDKLGHWHKPIQVMFSDGDPITGGAARFFRKIMPTAQDQPEIVIKGAGHFLQEEKGEEIAQHILEFIERSS